MKITLKSIIIAAISSIILLMLLLFFTEKPTSVKPIAEAISTGVDRVKEETVSICSDAIDGPTDIYTQPAGSVNSESTDDIADDSIVTFETEEAIQDTPYGLPDQWEGEEG